MYRVVPGPSVVRCPAPVEQNFKHKWMGSLGECRGWETRINAGDD